MELNYKVGDCVFWHDPANQTNGSYTVLGIQEPIDEDSIILIGNGVSEAEVTANELEHDKNGTSHMKHSIVSEILFDVTYQGEKYKDLDLGYHDDEDVTYDYIHYEDGPWGMVQVGENVMDFQIYGDEENELQMQACMMIPSSQIINDEVELCWGHGDFIDDIEVSNIRVKYTEPVCHIKPKK